MDFVKRLFTKTTKLKIGAIETDVVINKYRDPYPTLRECILKYLFTGGIERQRITLKEYIGELVLSDLKAKHEWLMKGKGGYYPSLLALALPLACLLVKRRLARAAYLLATVPSALLLSYTLLPREAISTYRLRKQCEADMDDEADALSEAEFKRQETETREDGSPILSGSVQSGVVAVVAPKRRNRYAAKIARVARSKVGYLSNTPENRLIYQRVLLEIMDKDCVRYADRDGILPAAVGFCFVYQSGVREVTALWDSKESLGVK